MFDRIAFVIGEAGINMRRNGFMTFAAVSTVAVSLYLLGGMLYLLYVGEREMRSLPSQFDIRVLLKEGVDYQQVVQTAKQLRAIPGVKTAVHIPRDKAWEKLRTKYPEEMTEGVTNPLTHAFKVTVEDLKDTEPVVTAIQKIGTVNKVRYQPEVQRFLEQIMGLLRWIGTVLGGTLFVTAGILIFNAIKMTVLARRREVRIMSLVGASVWTIQIPFLIEGLFQGVAGGTLAAVLLVASNEVTKVRLLETSVMQVPVFPIAPAVAILGLAGGVYGLFCSSLALRMR